ncbi:hypothetical protein N9369_02165 [Candidatus Pelagibacter sp.]|nr:hypothetical protein [Candidatus Pelagibacter sp.]
MIDKIRVFVHIGAPKSASSSLQHFFHFNRKINFLGIIRDHENYIGSNIYNSDFHAYCRYKNNYFNKAKNIKKKLSKKKINLVSDEDFFTSEFANFKKKIKRIIKIFPNCEFIVVLRDPIKTIKSWHDFNLRRNEKIPLSIIQYVKQKNLLNVIDLIDYKKRINYFKSLKKNKFHVIDFNVIEQNKILLTLGKIFETNLYYEKNKNFLEKKNSNVYFLKILFTKIPWTKKLKFILPRFFIRSIKKFLSSFDSVSKYRDTMSKSETKYLNKLFVREIRYYKLLFKKKSYFTLN